MALQNEKGTYNCSNCGKEFKHPQLADQCRDSHDLIYLAITREDYNRLMMFIQLKQEELLTTSLIKSLSAPRRNKST